ncbi:MAG: AAA family ATPase [Dehalococcoidia bacterium]
MAEFEWGISTLTFSGGTAVSLPRGCVLVVIGPNGSGKSTSLHNIEDALTARREGHPLSVVTEVRGFHSGDADSFLRWVELNHESIDIEGERGYVTKRGFVRKTHIDDLLPGRPGFGHVFHAVLVEHLDAESRLALTNYTRSIEPHSEAPEAYVHLLQRSDHLLAEASQEVQAAFGVDLIINWGGSSQVGFHVGEEPERTVENDRVSTQYLARLHELARLEHAGDGIRSFVGSLLAALCGAHPVLLIDEPEAFLHPPQAKRLGRALGAISRERDRQFILATHSTDLLQGAISGGAAVVVCRITRQGSETQASVLQSEEIRELWAKPLMRSSAAIDGLFHEGVVVCEGDSDARFYEALMRHLDRSGTLGRPADVFFVHGNGKGGVPALTSSYRRLAVRTATIVDLDILRDDGQLERVLSSHGIAYNAHLHGQMNRIRNELGAANPTRPLEEFTSAVSDVLGGAAGQSSLGSNERRRLIELIEDSSSWSEVKRYGLGKLVGGGRRELEEILAAWAQTGLFVVPRGDLEGWWPRGSRDKNAWFVEALDVLETNPAELQDSLTFVEKVHAWLSNGGPSSG